MPRLPRVTRTTQLLVWSSPLLLVLLTFTLTNQPRTVPTTTRPSHSRPAVTSTTFTVTTTTARVREPSSSRSTAPSVANDENSALESAAAGDLSSGEVATIPVGATTQWSATLIDVAGVVECPEQSFVVTTIFVVPTSGCVVVLTGQAGGGAWQLTPQ